MDHRSLEYTHEKIVKMFPARVLSGGGGGRKRTGVLSGMIIWNVLVLILLVLAVCVQGRGGAVPSDTSSNLALGRLTRDTTKKDKAEADSPLVKPSGDPGKSAGDPAPSPQAPQANDSKDPKDSQPAPKSRNESEKKEEEVGKEGGGDTQLNPENKSGNTNATTKGDTGNGSTPHIPGMSSEAVLRGFYVFVGVGAIILIYIIIKLARMRKRRAPGKYRVLSHTDDQEMFPLAAGEGEDEEIFNAAHHQLRK